MRRELFLAIHTSSARLPSQLRRSLNDARSPSARLLDQLIELMPVGARADYSIS